MDSRWKKIEHIFLKALELGEEKRPEFIRSECAGDHAMEAEVWSLLKAHHSESILDQPIDSYRKSVLFEASNESLKGEQVGKYQIIEEIGHGGMGSVYLAERADGEFERKVALKFLRNRFAAPDQIARFKRERSILAALNHEHIAKLLDAGVTRYGQPWFVMELIEGKPITEYCDENKLPLRDRVQLFIDVCNAVHYAHQKLVIHRDLKPANILVSNDGTVKLLDFGIAKITDQSEIPADNLQTKEGLLPLTPVYASPEQAGAGTITTSSDIYQLGVILYELLSGFRPYDLTTSSPAEIEKTICELEPADLSAHFSGTSLIDVAKRATLESVCKNRSADLKRLKRELQSDVRTIVQKAIRKEQPRRYGSAGQLAEDLQRYLHGKPVQAHPDSKIYRFRKLLNRHPVESFSSALLIVMVAGYLFTVSWHSAQIKAALERAETETAKSEQVVDFLMGMFEASDPFESLGGTVTAGALLDRGLRHTETLDDQPEVQAQMLDVIGRVWYSLGEYEKAYPPLERALLLRENDNYTEKYVLADNYYNLASAKHHLGDYRESNELYQKALQIYQNLPDYQSAEYAASLYVMAGVKTVQGQYEAAISMHNRALQMRVQMWGEIHPDVAAGYMGLGQAYHLKGDQDRAISLLEKAGTILHEIHDTAHPAFANLYELKGRVLQESDEEDRAEAHFLQALQIRESALGTDHIETGISRKSLADFYSDEGRFEAARQLYLELLSEVDDSSPLKRPVVEALAKLYMNNSAPELAEPLHRKTIEMLRSSLGTHHPRLLRAQLNHSVSLIELGNFEEAEVILTTTLERASELNSGSYPELKGQVLSKLIVLYEKRGLYPQAEYYSKLLKGQE
jgi:eukaryotic-like serine/threonine-protein kinase